MPEQFTVPARFTQPIKSAPQQIASAIKESIVDGTLSPGSRLPTELELTELFGVSRPTLREALKELRTTGVLVAERGRNGGYRVAEFSPRALASTVGEFVTLSIAARTTSYVEIFEVRHALEVLAAQSAARNRTDADLERLEHALPRDPFEPFEKLLSDDVRFHRTLADASHNALIIAYNGASLIALQRFNNLEASHSKEIVAHLDEVLVAVRDRDPNRAGDAMQRHLRYFVEFYDKLPWLARADRA